MKTSHSLLGLCLLLPAFATGQTVEGTVYDTDNGNSPLPGVTIQYTGKSGPAGAVSNADGSYEITVPEGGLLLTVRCLGYETQTVPLVVGRKEVLTKNIYMQPSTTALNAVVVSAGRFEQKLSDISVSMDILKSADILKQNPADIRATLTTLPGVDINDKQPSIRGGNGWTYGVGSRCLILADGMSILTPNSGEINWNAAPTENVEQIEVIKGASSVLYGSSALNGLINIRTARPGIDPETRINAYLGIYGNPDNDGYIWWNREFWKSGKYDVEPLFRNSLLSGVRNPLYTGLDFSHSRRIGNWDVTGSLNLLTDEGYKEGGFNKRMRIGGSVSHHNPDVPGLHYGLNLNFMTDESADVFLWRSPEEPYRQSPLTNMSREGNQFYVDPFINYFDAEHNISHKFKGRIYTTSDNIVSRTTDKSIVEIAGNMGFDYVNSIPEIVGYVQNPDRLLELFKPAIPSMLQGDFTQAAGIVSDLGNRFFPDAKPADYMDLVSWIIGRTPFPQTGSDWVQWALEMDKTKKKPLLHPDRNDSYYFDYQLSKKFDRAQITAGATYEHVYVDAQTTGRHRSDNAALYFQYDDRFFERLNLTLGVRFEYYRVDNHYREAETKLFGASIPVKPVFRGGLTYKLAEYSFLRASFGQGYRYPSITEKYVLKDIGGIGAYPNPSLKAESGFNAELGFRQGYRFGPFKGSVDVAGFYTEYKDMIEFNIGLFDPQPPYTYINSLSKAVSMIAGGTIPGIGAQFYNMKKARIYGVDLSVNGVCDLTAQTKLVYNLGYVYIEPEDADYKARNEREEAYTDPLQMKLKSNNSKYLKYRQKHTVKGVFDLQWKRFNIGTNLTWKSKTLAVDYFLVDEREKERPELMDYLRGMLFGDLNGYWNRINKGYFVMDLRVGVDVTQQVRFQFSIQNLLNKEYSLRPMDVAAPRTFLFQVNARF